MIYLKRQTLTLVLNRFKTSADGWRSGERDNDAVARAARRKLLERIEKRIWKRLWVPLSSHMTGIWDSCTLIVLSIRASIIFIVPLSRFHYTLRGLNCAHLTSTLRCHRDCAWRSWLCPRCCSDAFNCFTMHSCDDTTSALPFPPCYIVLVRAQTRCACFKPT